MLRQSSVTSAATARSKRWPACSLSNVPPIATRLNERTSVVARSGMTRASFTTLTAGLSCMDTCTVCVPAPDDFVGKTSTVKAPYARCCRAHLASPSRSLISVSARKRLRLVTRAWEYGQLAKGPLDLKTVALQGCLAVIAHKFMRKPGHMLCLQPNILPV